MPTRRASPGTRGHVPSSTDAGRAGHSRDAPSTRARSFADRLAEQLGRVTSGGELVPEIDGLRCIAIGGVIYFHTGSM